MGDLLMHRVRVPAPIARVRHALTDPGALRVWLAEHVDVRLPERFHFWGRFTPEGDAPHQRLLHVDDHSLRFRWRLDETDTTVEFALAEEDPDNTVLTLTQTDLPDFDEMVAEASTLGQMHTFWALSIANLVEYVEGRERTPKCDFAVPDMRAEVTVDASPEAVYRSLVDPGQFAQWFGARIDIEPEVGGRWAMGGFDVDPAPARIIELDPGSRLALAWDDGLVTSWELAGSEGHTRLTIVQSGFDTDRPPYGSWMGLLGGIAELRRYHGLAGWRPIWIEVRLNNAPDGIIAIG
ncbi:SRPBCC family protein [Actinoplanes siamensis]|uniref:Activator of Hsp90 ATPase homologue 1/2-like C-terminal domain-containing protein n=1 Tax=Actinoplanes siamensis TaxID=1223317 RepID=A0A919N9Z3_9ACTN|nr:SRPBCC domain-containing protein [Actinoplanes siamensis]GIF07022.1 hypothetical protein Asi03nite_45600 [Actinoplanes siamensis]